MNEYPSNETSHNLESITVGLKPLINQFFLNYSISFFEFNRRQVNGVAHELARVAPSEPRPHIYDDVPSCIRHI